MNTLDIEQRVIAIVAAEANRSVREIDKNTNLIYNLFIDSLTMLEICFSIEDHFNIVIKDEERRELETITLITAHIDKKLKEKEGFVNV